MPKLNQNDNSNPSSNHPFKTSYLYLIAIVLIAIFTYVFVANYNSKKVDSYNDADISTKTGELYKILDEENVTKLSMENHKEGGFYYLSGSYTKGNDSEVYYFEATINSDNTVAIDNYTNIIDTRVYSETDGTIVQYYGGSRGIYTIVDYSTETSFADYIPTIIIWAIVIILGIYLFRKLSKSIGSSGGAANAQFNFNKSRARRQTQSKVRFSDVAGCDEVKAELAEMVDYFRNAKKYTRLGAKLPHGVLLVGPPGTGKTLLAKAVAGEAKVPFYSISGSDFVEMYVGVGAGRVRDMFKVAKQNAPCLIFIDEIDAVGRQRGAGMGGGNDEREQTLNQLLVEMDGFSDNNGIIVMAATNRSDVLDPALTRAGRFDKQITVDLPDKEGREAVLKVHSRNKIIAPDVDFKAIASRTVGFSGADLENILNDAAILAVREKREAITMGDIDEAIDRQIAGPAKTNRGISPEEKKRIAYHESGHAVLGIRLEHSEKVQRITIIPRGRTGGHVLMTPENDRFVLTKSELIARIVGLLGGRTSEELFIGDVSTGASNDIEQATRIARLMVTEYGMSELGPIQYEKNTGSVFLGRDYNSNKSNYSTQVAFEIDKAVRQIIDDAHDKAVEVLNKYKDDVALIAKTLMDKETITAEQIEYLIKNRKLPPEPPKVVVPDVEEEKPETADKKVVLETKELSPKQKELQKGLKIIKDKIGTVDNEIIFLVVEDQDGLKLTPRGVIKAIQQSYAKHIAKEIAEGGNPKIVNKPCISLTYSKSEIDKMADSIEEFAGAIEDETRTLVVVIKVSTDDFTKFKDNFEKVTGNSIVKVTPPSPKGEKTQRELKDLVNKEEDDKDKK